MTSWHVGEQFTVISAQRPSGQNTITDIFALAVSLFGAVAASLGRGLVAMDVRASGAA
jgi:hypothetical protein